MERGYLLFFPFQNELNVVTARSSSLRLAEIFQIGSNETSDVAEATSIPFQMNSYQKGMVYTDTDTRAVQGRNLPTKESIPELGERTKEK